ncbi:MAG: hypothetical protein OEW39_12670 [Deltaproteobacteria bacterium]|nr:hypothetical protein [Deltaproteobacteria bacterium]
MTITRTTIQSSQEWFQSGVERVLTGRINLGLNYLDRAIAVFKETGDLQKLTLARHYKLLAYLLDSRAEEAESLFVEVMAGYTRLEDAYGQGLALAHLGEALTRQDRLTGAISHFNQARVIAETHNLLGLLAYVLQHLGQLHLERDNMVQALRLFELAEALATRESLGHLFSQFRFQRAEILVRLGESGTAFALLEDVQTRLLSAGEFEEALRPLSLLRTIYEERDMGEDLERIVALLHSCGQKIIGTEGQQRSHRYYDGPPIGKGR